MRERYDRETCTHICVRLHTCIHTYMHRHTCLVGAEGFVELAVGLRPPTLEHEELAPLLANDGWEICKRGMRVDEWREGRHVRISKCYHSLTHSLNQSINQRHTYTLVRTHDARVGDGGVELERAGENLLSSFVCESGIGPQVCVNTHLLYLPYPTSYTHMHTYVSTFMRAVLRVRVQHWPQDTHTHTGTHNSQSAPVAVTKLSHTRRNHLHAGRVAHAGAALDLERIDLHEVGRLALVVRAVLWSCVGVCVCVGIGAWVM